MRGFGEAEELATVWQSTLLNIHPATYEAYGMTIVEAAAFGVPSLLHLGTIGAKDLLPGTPSPLAVYHTRYAVTSLSLL